MRKKYLFLLGVLLLTLFSISAYAGDGDVYYFTDTDITFEDAQFSIIITVFLFMFFFAIGYLSPKHSGGGFMIFSSLLLFSLEALLIPFLSAVLVISLISPFALFILFLGIRKQFFPFEGEKTKTEGQ